MDKKLICIECPKGCTLNVVVQKGAAVKVDGFSCEKGEKYAVNEINDPKRGISSTVRAVGLEVNMVPVKTEKSVPKNKIIDIMEKIRRTVISGPVNAGDVVIKNVAGTEINVVATRCVS